MSKSTKKLEIDEILTKVKALCFNKIDKDSDDSVLKLLSDSFSEVVTIEERSISSVFGQIDNSQVMFEVDEGEFFPLFSMDEQNDYED